jgi:hypothetical protein
MKVSAAPPQPEPPIPSRDREGAVFSPPDTLAFNSGRHGQTISPFSLENLLVCRELL